MLWLIGIASIWSVCCVLAVALCVMARRGDEAMEHAMARVVASEPPAEVAFVATFSEPTPAAAARPRVPQQRPVA
jgi:hypothetical protein